MASILPCLQAFLKKVVSVLLNQKRLQGVKSLDLAVVEVKDLLLFDHLVPSDVGSRLGPEDHLLLKHSPELSVERGQVSFGLALGTVDLGQII